MNKLERRKKGVIIKRPGKGGGNTPFKNIYKMGLFT